MKHSALLAASGALLALASPLDLRKRAIETAIVTEWTTVTVTEGGPATVFAAVAHIEPAPVTTSSTPEPTVAPATPTVAPAPPPATSSPPPPPPPPPAPKPKPKTTSQVHKAPVAQPSPKPAPASSPAPAKPAPASDPAPSDYASTAVHHHNIHRANHSAPAVSWSDEHASYAAQTAAKCVFKHDLSPGGGGYGQNLALWGSSGNAEGLGSSKAVAQGITDMWYNGELPKWPPSNYGKSNPDMSSFEDWGHLTQVLWAGTQKVGCHSQYCPPGTVYASMGSWFTVCNYYPPGNVGGAYGKNVHPPSGEAVVTV